MRNVTAIVKTSISAIAISVAIGCAAKQLPLPDKITLPIVHGEQEAGAATVGKTNLQLSLEAIKDSRPKKEIVTSGDNDSLPNGDVGSAVAQSITSVLSANGFSIGDAAPLVLSAELLEWSAEARGSKVNSGAALAIKLYDPANKLIYTGKYQGSANMQKGGLVEADYQEVLQTSLHEALAQICRDQKLIDLISSF